MLTQAPKSLAFLILLCLPALTGMLRTMNVRCERLAQAAAGGFTNATDLADYLVVKGLPFRSAHEVSGKLVRHCIERGLALENLTLSEFQAFSALIGEDVYEAISIAACVSRRKITGAPAREAVEAAITNARKRFGESV